jgi:hypothetical protein
VFGIATDQEFVFLFKNVNTVLSVFQPFIANATLPSASAVIFKKKAAMLRCIFIYFNSLQKYLSVYLFTEKLFNNSKCRLGGTAKQPEHGV